MPSLRGNIPGAHVFTMDLLRHYHGRYNVFYMGGVLGSGSLVGSDMTVVMF